MFGEQKSKKFQGRVFHCSQLRKTFEIALSMLLVHSNNQGALYCKQWYYLCVETFKVTINTFWNMKVNMWKFYFFVLSQQKGLRSRLLALWAAKRCLWKPGPLLKYICVWDFPQIFLTPSWIFKTPRVAMDPGRLTLTSGFWKFPRVSGDLDEVSLKKCRNSHTDHYSSTARPWKLKIPCGALEVWSKKPSKKHGNIN